MTRTLTTAVLLFVSFTTTTAPAQTYCLPYQQPAVPMIPVVTYYSPPYVLQNPTVTSAYSCPIASAEVYRGAITMYAPEYAPVTTYRPSGPTYQSGPGHSVHDVVESTVVTVVNTTPRELSRLWVAFIDDKGVEHKSNIFSVRANSKSQIGNLNESPRVQNGYVALAVFSEDKSVEKGKSVGIPQDQLFVHYCGEGTTAIGLSLP